MPSKTRKVIRIPISRNADLSRYGYSKIMEKTVTQRHKALMKVIRSAGKSIKARAEKRKEKKKKRTEKERKGKGKERKEKKRKGKKRKRKEKRREEKTRKGKEKKIS